MDMDKVVEQNRLSVVILSVVVVIRRRAVKVIADYQ